MIKLRPAGQAWCLECQLVISAAPLQLQVGGSRNTHTYSVLSPFFALIIMMTVGGVSSYIIHRRHFHTFCRTPFVSV